jgi:4-diphosphocytidyl-2-C-methyl-D-erythritol kinase
VIDNHQEKQFHEPCPNVKCWWFLCENLLTSSELSLTFGSPTLIDNLVTGPISSRRSGPQPWTVGMVAPALTHGRDHCISASSDALVVAAPAKLNLFLEILGKRPDGYHDLQSLMVAVNLFDTLELQVRTDGLLAIECEPPGLTTGPDNLVYKAAEKLRSKVHRKPGSQTKANRGVGVGLLGASIRLTKRISMQAGLAGGSSDAAAALLGLNQLWGLNLARTELAQVAADIGSDVAFFLSGPAAWCTGRGELVSTEASSRSFDMVLVCPPVGLGTAEVYRQVEVPAVPVDGSAARDAFRGGDPEALGAALFNRLQAAAFHLAPVVETVYRRLAGLNPAGCLMSGSGSAVYALCRDAHEARRVANAFQATRPPNEPESRVTVVRTL